MLFSMRQRCRQLRGNIADHVHVIHLCSGKISPCICEENTSVCIDFFFTEMNAVHWLCTTEVDDDKRYSCSERRKIKLTTGRL